MLNKNKKYSGNDATFEMIKNKALESWPLDVPTEDNNPNAKAWKGYWNGACGILFNEMITQKLPSTAAYIKTLVKLDENQTVDQVGDYLLIKTTDADGH